MHRISKAIVSFVDEFTEIFDEDLLTWCSILTFLIVTIVGTLFFAPVEGLICGTVLAIAAHMFVSEWKYSAELLRPRRRRARSMLIDISEIKNYSPSDVSRQP